MNKDFHEPFGQYIFEDFNGTYADYFLYCCKIFIFGSTATAYDSLIALAIYNLYIFSFIYDRLPYVFNLQWESGRALVRVLLHIGSIKSLEQKQCNFSALFLIANSIDLSIRSNLDAIFLLIFL